MKNCCGHTRKLPRLLERWVSRKSAVDDRGDPLDRGRAAEANNVLDAVVTYDEQRERRSVEQCTRYGVVRNCSFACSHAHLLSVISTIAELLEPRPEISERDFWRIIVKQNEY